MTVCNMAALVTFDPTESPEHILEAFRRDGAVILKDVLTSDQLGQVKAELDPWLQATPTGIDDFTGRQTQRTGALVARSVACRDLVMEPTILDLANQFLGPFCERIQLHLTQIINLGPGQGRQPFHRDRLAWGGYLPAEIEPQFNTIWALTDFTEENGATRVVPGSPTWDYERRAGDDEKTQAVMSAGSVLLYSGSVIHSGGENKSDHDRTGINITYCLGWLRTEENQYLSCPPEIAKDLPPELTDLLGYTQGTYALGYYSEPGEMGSVSDLRPPELALGRTPSGRTLGSTATE